MDVRRPITGGFHLVFRWRIYSGLSRSAGVRVERQRRRSHGVQLGVRGKGRAAPRPQQGVPLAAALPGRHVLSVVSF